MQPRSWGGMVTRGSGCCGASSSFFSKARCGASRCADDQPPSDSAVTSAHIASKGSSTSSSAVAAPNGSSSGAATRSGSRVAAWRRTAARSSASLSGASRESVPPQSASASSTMHTNQSRRAAGHAPPSVSPTRSSVSSSSTAGAVANTRAFSSAATKRTSPRMCTGAWSLSARCSSCCVRVATAAPNSSSAALSSPTSVPYTGVFGCSQCTQSKTVSVISERCSARSPSNARERPSRCDERFCTFLSPTLTMRLIRRVSKDSSAGLSSPRPRFIANQRARDAFCAPRAIESVRATLFRTAMSTRRELGARAARSPPSLGLSWHDDRRRRRAPPPHAPPRAPKTSHTHKPRPGISVAPRQLSG